MAIGASNSGEDFGEINITPLTDVFLILFLIMIVIAPLMHQTALKITPPLADHGVTTSTQGKVLNIEVAEDGMIAINGKKLREEPLKPEEVSATVMERLQEIISGDESYKDAPLNVIADQETKQKYLVGVLDAAAGLELKKMNIVTVSSL